MLNGIEHNLNNVNYGADPGFSERGSERLKKGVWTAAPEAIVRGCIL